MTHFSFDLVDAIHFEVGALTNSAGRFFGDQASFRQGLSCRHLDRQPGSKTVFVTPNLPHLGAGIARDHGSALSKVAENGGLGILKEVRSAYQSPPLQAVPGQTSEWPAVPTGLSFPTYIVIRYNLTMVSLRYNPRNGNDAYAN